MIYHPTPETSELISYLSKSESDRDHVSGQICIRIQVFLSALQETFIFFGQCGIGPGHIIRKLDPNQI